MERQLTNVERELVALGAALASNCVPCIEHHIPEARRAGLSDGQINEALQLADRIRQVPAGNVLSAALGLLSTDENTDASRSGSTCGQPASTGKGTQPCCG